MEEVCSCPCPIPQATLNHACQNCYKILPQYFNAMKKEERSIEFVGSCISPAACPTCTPDDKVRLKLPPIELNLGVKCLCCKCGRDLTELQPTLMEIAIEKRDEQIATLTQELSTKEDEIKDLQKFVEEQKQGILEYVQELSEAKAEKIKWLQMLYRELLDDGNCKEISVEAGIMGLQSILSEELQAVDELSADNLKLESELLEVKAERDLISSQLEDARKLCASEVDRLMAERDVLSDRVKLLDRLVNEKATEAQNFYNQLSLLKGEGLKCGRCPNTEHFDENGFCRICGFKGEEGKGNQETKRDE